MQAHRPNPCFPLNFYNFKPLSMLFLPSRHTMYSLALQSPVAKYNDMGMFPRLLLAPLEPISVWLLETLLSYAKQKNAAPSPESDE